jgi:hypothetical protein
MNWRILLIVVAGAALVAVLAWLLLGGAGRLPRRDRIVPAGELPTPTPAPEQQVVLLFIGSDGRLHPELRQVRLPKELDARVRVVVSELLFGPTGGLGPVVPYPAEVNSVFVDSDGSAYVDITAPPAPLDGSHTELMLVYGVVDSVLLNCPELNAVQILFGGREIDTLTGHLDLSKPLVLNKRFIAAS